MSQFAVILPAAGKSSRFSMKKRKKPFVDLKGRAVWLRSVEHFVNRDDVAQTILAIAPNDRDWFCEKFQPNLAFLDIEVVDGGASRADSVFNALQRVSGNVDFVAVHDAARPLLVKEWVDQVFQAAEEFGAVIPALSVSGTLKQVDPHRNIEKTVPRDNLWEAQTPQVFRRELLLEAFEKRGDLQPTDEAQLVEQLGHPVRIIQGWPMNFKITTADDFKMAEAVLNALPRSKPLGALHPFADENPSLFS